MIHDHTPFESPFIDEAILPVQHLGRRRLLEPWQRLMLAVLFDAIRCYQVNLTSSTGGNRLLFTEAEEWLFARSESEPFACDTVCHAIGIDPEYLRDGLKQWRGKHLEEPNVSYPNRRVVRMSAQRQRNPQTRGAFTNTSFPYQRPAIEATTPVRRLGERGPTSRM